MKLGIDRLCTELKELMKDKRIGLLAHQASVDSSGRYTVDLFTNDSDVNLVALFGPEHGIASKAQDMEAVENVSVPHHTKNITVYSLYGSSFKSLSPTEEMLSNIDLLVIDLQDVGSRYYTYIWTTILSLKACAKANKKVIVLDRPNPINGVDIEGELQHAGFESFVGLYPLPVRHGMTIGEIARFINEEYQIGCDLHVIEMEGWKREWFWRDTHLEWINPSPNMRSFNAALLYPGMCLLEGTNISEGRGTDTPFEIVGAPYIDSEELLRELEMMQLPGVRAAPTSFIPVRQKWMGNICQGVRWAITDERIFKPYMTGLAYLWVVNKLYKEKGFAWRTEPYEFVSDKPAIDLLTGSSYFRENIDHDFVSLIPLFKISNEFSEKRQEFLLY
jgi:uncharacterized protein YbbC (DUF1343 family)